MSDYHGTVIAQPLSVQLRDNFRDYGMSVIMGRALPDVRDGLKPCLLYTSPSPRDS